MRSFTSAILLTYIATAPAEELAANPMDRMVDNMVDTLTDKTLALSQPITLRSPMSVTAMQNTLKMYGVPESPLQRLALTQMAATRDPSMKAQAREAFSSLDPATQAKFRKARGEIVARATILPGDPLPAGEKGLKLESMPGLLAPFDKPWDPFNFATDIPAGRLYFYRETELKNGRLAMLAFLSIVITDKFGFHPFYGSGEYVSAIQSHPDVNPVVSEKFWSALTIACGVAELFSYADHSKAPGDLGFDPLGLKPKTEKEFNEIQNKELSNGRLAMIAMAGIYAQEVFRGAHPF